jgi:hypothetical protein
MQEMVTASGLSWPSPITASEVRSIAHSRLSTGGPGCGMAMMSPQKSPYLNQCLLLRAADLLPGNGRGRKEGEVNLVYLFFNKEQKGESGVICQVASLGPADATVPGLRSNLTARLDVKQGGAGRGSTSSDITSKPVHGGPPNGLPVSLGWPTLRG